MNAREDVDVAALEAELRKNIRGEVRFSDGDRALYSTDSSNYRQIPIGVVIPRDRSDVIATVASCRRYGAPITGRGGGTSLAGQCCNVAVIIDFTKYYNRILELEVLLYDGTILRVGKTSPLELEQIIQGGGRRGEIYHQLRGLRDQYGELVRQRYPKIPRRVSGYNLDDLLPENGFNVARALVGTEGTCALVLEATLELIVNPPVRSLLVLGYPDIYHAGDHVPEIRKYKPVGLEGIDAVLIDAMKVKHIHPRDLEILPEGKGWLLVEFGGNTTEEADAPAKKLMAELKAQSNPPAMRLVDDPTHEAVVWEIRDAGLGASARVPNQPDTWEGWEDSAVSPNDIGKYLRDFRALLDKHGYLCTLYGHFGQGLVHTRIDFGLKNHAGIQKYLAFTNEAADLVVRYGGSLSGEHGDGQSRGELLSKMFGNELVEAFVEFKQIWDPDWKMNPGKIVRPYRRDENLRYGEHYNPPQWKTYFKYPNDNGSFPYAIERCVGVGKCRRNEHGTMCPSYMVTREEKHSTRGRARLLWEMLNNDVLRKKGWREECIKEALDLCLAC